MDILRRYRWQGILTRARAGRAKAPQRAASHTTAPGTTAAIAGGKGANLIGHPLATLGIGAHVRKSAHAFAVAKIPFALVNIYDHIDPYGDKFPEFPFTGHLTRANPYPVSLFHLNADEMPQAFMHLGPSFFEQRYNIGFGLWELSKFPDAWLASFR